MSITQPYNKKVDQYANEIKSDAMQLSLTKGVETNWEKMKLGVILQVGYPCFNAPLGRHLPQQHNCTHYIKFHCSNCHLFNNMVIPSSKKST